MIRSFVKTDKNLVADTLFLHARNQLPKLDALFVKEALFEAYIEVVSMVELPLKILAETSSFRSNALNHSFFVRTLKHWNKLLLRTRRNHPKDFKKLLDCIQKFY